MNLILLFLPLILLSIWSMSIIIDRYLFFRSNRVFPESYQKFWINLRQSQLKTQDDTNIAEKNNNKIQNTDDMFADLLAMQSKCRSFLSECLSRQDKKSWLWHFINDFESSVLRQCLQKTSDPMLLTCQSQYGQSTLLKDELYTLCERLLHNIEKPVANLAVIAKTAPMLGLLGTVVGLIQIFYNLSAIEKIDNMYAIMAGGIYQALLSTMLGLIIAIPAIYFHKIFSLEIDCIAIELYKKCHELYYLLLALGQRPGQPGSDNAIIN